MACSSFLYLHFFTQFIFAHLKIKKPECQLGVFFFLRGKYVPQLFLLSRISYHERYGLSNFIISCFMQLFFYVVWIKYYLCKSERS